MSATKDAARLRALIEVIEALAKGERKQFGTLVSYVFGWSPERVFKAIDKATELGLIAKNAPSNGPNR